MLPVMPTREMLARLPDIEPLRKRSQALAVMDAIMSPDWKYRYFLFNSTWADGEMMATITNGSGDDLFVLFTEAGAIMKGFDHESFMSPWARNEKSLWPGLFRSVPIEFASFLTEPAFSIQDSTFCIWRRNNESIWHADDIEYPDQDGTADGSSWMLQEYVDGPEAYVDFCKHYYECEVPLRTVQEFWESKPLDEEMMLALNPMATLASLQKDLLEIGYPTRL